MLPRILLTAILLLGFMLLLAGCSDDDSPTGPDASQLEGTWQAISATIDGQAANLAFAMDWSQGPFGR